MAVALTEMNRNRALARTVRKVTFLNDVNHLVGLAGCRLLLIQ